MEDKFFETLLLDGIIMYNVYSNKTLVISYGDISYNINFEQAMNLFPNRRKYTLQTIGIYLFACFTLNLNTTLDRETIISNYSVFKGKNLERKTDLLSLLLVSIPSFVTPLLSGGGGIPVSMSSTSLPSTKLNPIPQTASPNQSSGLGMGIYILLTILIILVAASMIMNQRK